MARNPSGNNKRGADKQPPEPRVIRLLMELRRLGVHDHRVLGAIEKVPRENYVAPQFLDRAYDNIPLPIGMGQTISQPLIVALMTQELEIGDRMRVLEIGTGSGYQAAVLSHLCRRVYTIERHAQLLKEAERRFKEMDIHNITTMAGDGSKGWPQQAPFDRIIVTAASTEVPEALAEQLADGGIMVVPVGRKGFDQELVRVTKGADGIESKTLYPVRFVPLIAG